MSEKAKIGMGYIRLMKKDMNVYEVAEHVDESVEHVKEHIAAARKEKEVIDAKVETYLLTPELDIRDEYYTGEMQTVESIEVEMANPIIVKYSRDSQTEFQTFMPVTIRIQRK